MSIHEASLDGDADGPRRAPPRWPTASPRRELGDLVALRGVLKFPVRIKCATLSWNTLIQGLDEVAAGVPPAEA